MYMPAVLHSDEDDHVIAQVEGLSLKVVSLKEVSLSNVTF